MSDLMTSFFGPLDKSACFYFFIISALFFISLVILFTTEIYYLIKNFGKIKLVNVINGLIILFNMFIAYFVNRLLYTMCNKTLV